MSEEKITKQLIHSDGRKLGLTDNAISLLIARDLRRNARGEIIEVPSQMFRRAARVLAEGERLWGEEADVELWFEEFYRILSRVDFIHHYALLNAGRAYQQFSACHVLPIDDSMEAIFAAVENNAFCNKWGAGTGIDFSPLRPRGSIVSTTGRPSSGAVSFMEIFDVVNRVISETALKRAGTMGILRVDHPDILEFIRAKTKPDYLTTFNLSVAVTDQFMEALFKNEGFELINPHTKEVEKKLPASVIWQELVERAWEGAEPGIIFIDEMNRKNPLPNVGEIRATNLCGEQPLFPFESCNLGYLNLSHFVGEEVIDWKGLGQIIPKAIRFLDNALDIQHNILEEMEKIVKGNRKIGLGVMGWADMLIKLNIPYDSEKALEMAEQLMEFITEKAREASVKLGKERGTFPNFKGSVWDQKGFKYLRNATVTTIAPTGNSSILGNCTSGIEPVYALCFTRRVLGKSAKKREELLEVNPLFESVAQKGGFYSAQLVQKIAQVGSCQGVDGVPEDIQKVFVTAYDIAPKVHVQMQAAFQKHTDNAVSKTVNLPYEASVEDVDKVFRLAYKLKCKGVTVYRDKSRERQVLEIGEMTKIQNGLEFES